MKKIGLPKLFTRKAMWFPVLLLLPFFESCSNEGQMDLKDVSAYISTVYDYQYAPGQHASLIPKNCNGSDFAGRPWTEGKTYTSLGGWGGYIVAGFGHTVKNVAGNDFVVYTQPGPASEPAVVYVMPDTNQDELPNDGGWIELKGSESGNAETIQNYQVTYTKPVGTGNIKWSDNLGNHGELVPVFDSPSWWWQGYGDQNEVTFSGVRLPNAYRNNSAQPDLENWVVRPALFSWGYAECYGNQDYNKDLKANLFDISNAVDAEGNAVNLSGIRFIKIQSAVFQVAGWLNEISTEVSGAADLSMLNVK